MLVEGQGVLKRLFHVCMRANNHFFSASYNLRNAAGMQEVLLFFSFIFFLKKDLAQICKFSTPGYNAVRGKWALGVLLFYCCAWEPCNLVKAARRGTWQDVSIIWWLQGCVLLCSASSLCCQGTKSANPLPAVTGGSTKLIIIFILWTLLLG